MLKKLFLYLKEKIIFRNYDCIIITGFESSTSVHLAQTISYASQKCKFFREWSGHGRNGKKGDKLIICHYSIPYGRNPKNFLDSLLKELSPLKYYNFKFIICTRDINISIKSRIERFGGSDSEYLEDNKIAIKNFKKIMSKYKYFLYSHEVAYIFKNKYFDILYKWLGIKSEFYSEIKNVNSKYLL